MERDGSGGTNAPRNTELRDGGAGGGATRQERTGTQADTKTGEYILHADMDAFFASCEVLDQPRLTGLPIAVGRDEGRGVVASASYEARKRGVRSAMPISQARRLCPELIVCPSRFDRYRELSASVMEIFRSVTPLVEQLSIDEAFLDVKGAVRLFGSPVEIARSLRQRVCDELGLPVSIGVAATKFVAKIASGRAKPDGLLVVPAARTLEFLHPLPVSALWGVGPKRQQELSRYGIHTIGELAATPQTVLQQHFGVAGAQLAALAHGLDPRPVETVHEEKSVGHETTFLTDVTDEAELARTLLTLSNRTAARLRHYGLSARTVGVKVRFGDFRTITRSRTLPEASNVARRFYEEARTLMESAREPGEPVRLLGVRAEGLTGESAALALWSPDDAWREAEAALDRVTARFGSGAAAPAALFRRTR